MMLAGSVSRACCRCARGVALLTGILLLAACGASPQPTAGPDVERGAATYARDCVGCHGGATGGTIQDVPPKHNASGHTWHHPDCQLVEIVLNGLPQRPQVALQMPAFREKLDQNEVQAVLAYIKTWWTPEQRAAQQKITKERCRGSA